MDLLTTLRKSVYLQRKEDILNNHKKIREQAKLNSERKYVSMAETIRSLYVEKEELRKTVDAMSEQKHQIEVDIDELKNTVLLMTNSKEMSESNIQELRKIKAVLDEEIKLFQLEKNEAHSGLVNSQKELKDLHSGFLKAISHYKKNLSLNIKFEEEDRIQVEFTDILTSEKKPCHFRLKLVDSKWMLVDIEPFFPDSKKLAQQMEATQDMQEFLACVRKQFKLVVNGKNS